VSVWGGRRSRWVRLIAFVVLVVVVRMLVPSPAGAAITVPYGQRVAITGAFSDGDGRPVVGLPVTVTSRMRMLGAPLVQLGRLTTDSRGRFDYLAPVGVSRTLTFRGDGLTTRVTLRVTPRITLTRRPTRIVGRVAGAPAGLRPPVELQALHGHGWRTFALARLTAHGGRFTHRGRAPRRVRALIRGAPDWPFATGTSEPTAGTA
jgi:hypothetical protein